MLWLLPDTWSRPRRQTAPPPHLAYDAVAEASAALVLRSYSSSFGVATRLLSPPVRTDVRNIYALVRLADELVDAPRPDGTAEQRAALLDALETETGTALATGHSANLVVHAFARSARRCGISPDLVAPFFASMRTDLQQTRHGPESFADYIYGSAEVVGLMCLRAFLLEPGAGASYDALAPAARALGSAFQRINFLRDLGTDLDELGRLYFPDVHPDELDDRTRNRLLDVVDGELATAQAALHLLPPSSRRAVTVAHDLFAELSARLRSAPVDRLRHTRVRVPGAVKARIVAAAVARSAR